MHERRIVTIVPALLGLAGVLGLAAPTGASQYPVPYNFSAGVLAAALTPGAPPPGSNDWSCRSSAAHPEPVILVHGLAANMTDNWQTLSPLLANNGYCVFALTYDTNPDFPFPLDQIGGLAPLEESAQTIGDFVDQVLAATGATKVNIVGHSEGATIPTTTSSSSAARPRWTTTSGSPPSTTARRSTGCRRT